MESILEADSAECVPLIGSVDIILHANGIEYHFPVDDIIDILWNKMPPIVTNEHATGLDRANRVALKGALKTVLGFMGDSPVIPKGYDYITTVILSVFVQFFDELARTEWIAETYANTNASGRTYHKVSAIVADADTDLSENIIDARNIFAGDSDKNRQSREYNIVRPDFSIGDDGRGKDNSD